MDYNREIDLSIFKNKIMARLVPHSLKKIIGSLIDNHLISRIYSMLSEKINPNIETLPDLEEHVKIGRSYVKKTKPKRTLMLPKIILAD